MKVGFFDSGIGGTCILAAFRRLCPTVETVYLADSEHCPYGNRPPEEIRALADACVRKFLAQGYMAGTDPTYMAGTDPTDATSRFTASVALEDGKPVVSWSPALNGEGVREGTRTYRVWGKESLTDAAWREVAPSGEAGYRFFRVTVEMP